MSTQSSEGNALDEWKEARAIIGRFDGNLHDLRKYGFSFVTALLAANGLLSVGGSSNIPVGVKASILVVTMGLIVTLKLLDTHYRRFQSAAATRGRILEDRLNLDLTNDISLLYKLQRWWRYVQYLYYGFVVLTALLGLALLWSDWALFSMVVFAAGLSILIMFFINREKPETELEDWSVDRKIVSQGTPVRITFTNLNAENYEKPDKFTLSWKVQNESEITGNEPTNMETFVASLLKKAISLKYFENYDMLWETEKVKPGLYELLMSAERSFGEKTGQNTEWLRLTIQVTARVETGKP